MSISSSVHDFKVAAATLQLCCNYAFSSSVRRSLAIHLVMACAEAVGGALLPKTLDGVKSGSKALKGSLTHLDLDAAPSG